MVNAASFYQSLKARAEGLIPMVTARECLGFAACTAVWQFARQSFWGTLATGGYFAWTMYLRSQEIVTSSNVEDRSARLVTDIRQSLMDGTFPIKKTLYLQRFARTEHVFQKAPTLRVRTNLDEVNRMFGRAVLLTPRAMPQLSPARASSPRSQFFRGDYSPLVSSPRAHALAQKQARNTLAHHMRTALGSTIGSLSLLSASIKKGQLDAEQLEYLRMSEMQANRALQRFNEFFNTAEAELDTRLIMRPFIFQNLQEMLEEHLTPLALAKGVKFSCDLDCNLPIQAVSDLQKIFQIIVNFAKEAIDTSSEGGSVLIRIKRDFRTAEDFLYFEVEGGKTAYGAQESASKGFTISRRLIQLMNGCISPKSEPSKYIGATSGHGEMTKVWFLIPLKTDAAITVLPERPKGVNLHRAMNSARVLHGEDFKEGIPPPREVQKVDAAAGQQKKRLLVLDDQDVILKIAHKMLTGMGFEVDCVKTTDEAVALVKKNEYYLVFLDYHLVNDTGARAAKEILKIKPGQLMIGASAGADAATQQGFLAAGVKEFMQKPFTTDKLQRLFKSL